MTERLDTGRVFDAIFKTYRAQFGVLIPAALIVFIPVAIVSGLLRDNGGIILVLVANVVSLIGTSLYQGVVVEAVRDIQDGRRDSSMGDLFKSVTPVLVSLVLAAIVAGIAIGIGFILIIIPGLILITWFAVFAPVIVLERAGPIDSLGRSYHLVRGNSWRVFGVIVVLFIVLFIVQLVLVAIVAAITDSVVGVVIASLLASLAIAPLSAIAATVMYLQLARIKGGGPADAGAVPVAPTAPDAPLPPGSPVTPTGLPGDTSSGLPGDPPSSSTGGSIPPPGIPGS